MGKGEERPSHDLCNKAVMKDSFCQMDAQSEVLDVLFDASWIWFGKDKQRPSCNWKRVKSNSDLQLWQDA